MRDNEKLTGYQRLEQDFFRLCRIRKIKGATMLVLIYLRGLYCRFRTPAFYCLDSIIMQDLSLSTSTLRRSRQTLQERGIIEFRAHHCRGKAVDYLILKTELAPELKKPFKMMGFRSQNEGFTRHGLHTKTRQNEQSIVSIKNKQKKRFSKVDPKKMHEDVLKLGKTIGNMK